MPLLKSWMKSLRLEKSRQRGVVDFFSNSHTKNVINKLKAAGVNLSAIHKETKTVSNIAGKSFVVTGTLNGYTRKEIEDIIRNLGGRVSSAVSSKTDFLIAGESPGSKLETAKKLGTTILSKRAFEDLINDGEIKANNFGLWNAE